MNTRDFMAMDFIKPCIVASYDHKNRTVKVMAQPKRLNNGNANEPLQVHDIPVCFPSWENKGFIVHPIKAGDAGLLLTCGRSTDEFMEGKLDAPEDPRMHDINDSFFLPCTFVHNPIETDGTCVHIEYGKTIFRLFEDHRIEIDGDIIHRGNYTQEGDYIQRGNYTQTGNRTQNGTETLTGNRTITGTSIHYGEMTVNGIPVSTHVHMDTMQQKGSVSGKPIP